MSVGDIRRTTIKILHVEGGRNLYGGSLQVLYLLEGLHQRGIANLLACRPDSELSRAARPFAEVCPLTMRGDLDVPLIGRIYRLVRRAQPDLVHLHSRIGADVMGALGARWAGAPIVHSRRQDNPEPRWMVAAKYRLHDRVIAISQGIVEVLLSEGLPSVKLRCVRDAVDPGPFQQSCDKAWFGAEFGLPARSRVLGVVAQLIPRKGHATLLGAMPALLAEFPDLRLIFFGQGPLEGELRASIALLGLSEQVQLAGFRTDLPKILGCLDLLVHPAFREGLGVSLLQASSAGVPIVACRAGGIPEAVRDGVNGLLVPPGDSSALGAAIARLLRDPDLARRLGEAGRALVQREFSVDAMVEGNLQVYRELLGSAAG
ncbi:MAG: glycosyltransferase [Methylotetracoccus sp.]|nr:glycosyltransferase [Methylotetracoccus sp.]